MGTWKRRMAAFAGAFALYAVTPARAETITIATISNYDMIIMQKLCAQMWGRATGNKINWVRARGKRAATARDHRDISTKAGRVSTSSFHRRYRDADPGPRPGWLLQLERPRRRLRLRPTCSSPLTQRPLLSTAIFTPVPFYAESSLTLYRKDLFEKAGLTMPRASETLGPGSGFRRPWRSSSPTGRRSNTASACAASRRNWGENMGLITIDAQ